MKQVESFKKREEVILKRAGIDKINRLKFSNGYDVSGSINTSSLLIGTNAGINPTSTLDVIFP